MSHNFLIFEDKSFADVGMFFTCLGGYTGMIYDNFFFGGINDNCNDTSFIKTILRIIVTLIVWGTCLIPYFIISFEANLYIVFVFKMSLPFFLMTFIWLSHLKHILRFLRLINEDDYTYNDFYRRNNFNLSADTGLI